MRSPYLVSLFHPLNLAVLALAVAAGLCAAWWLFPLGLLVWSLMFAGVAADPSLRISHAMRSRAPVAPRFQPQFDRIERSQVAIFNSMAAARPAMQRVLQPIRAEVDRLTDQAYQLCLRMTSVETYRAVQGGTSDLESELARIEAQLGKTTDTLTRREYEESRQATRARLTALRNISTQSERVEAQLSSLAAAMDGVLAEVIRLQAMGPDLAGKSIPALVRALRDQAEQLAEFEREAAGLVVS